MGGHAGQIVEGTDTKGAKFLALLAQDTANIIGPPPTIAGQDDHAAWNTYARETQKKFTASEKAVVDSYQGSGYREMNKVAAGLAPSSPAMDKKLRDMDAAVAKGRVPHDVIVRRGIEANLADVIGSTADKDSLVGGIFEHKGFMSTSRSFGFSRKIGLVMKVPKGTVGLPMPEMGSENEIVLPRNAMLRIMKIEGSGKATSPHIVHCEYLGTRSATS